MREHEGEPGNHWFTCNAWRLLIYSHADTIALDNRVPQQEHRSLEFFAPQTLYHRGRLTLLLQLLGQLYIRNNSNRARTAC